MSFSRDVAKSLALLISASALAAPAFAQQAQPAPTESGAAAEEELIVVIGTRIRGLDLDGAEPGVQIDREEIVESGATEIIDVLRDLSITAGGAGTFSTSTAGALSSDTPVGAAGVSLRGLGTSATLTLINGRRASISAFARGQESFIDVNAIPLAAIERVEVLPSGASALYGADAVAGVVNFVLREDFEGLELSGSYGDSTAESDEGRFNVSVVGGGEFGGHRVLAVADYFKRNGFFDRDRAISRDSVRPSQQGFYPSFNDLFFSELGFDQTEEPQDGGCPADSFDTGRLGEFCEVDTNDFTSINDELESIGGLFTHRYDVNSSITWFNEALYQRSESRGTSSPANFSRAPIDPENPLWPQALIDDIVADGIETQQFLRDTNDPDYVGFVPSDIGDYFGFPIFAWGKIPEPRAVEVESESLRLTSGFEVAFGGSWTGEVAALYGRNERTQRGVSGLAVSQAFYDLNLGNICTDGTRVRRWDVNPVRPSASQPSGYETCEDTGRTTLWYNPFGGQSDQAPGVAELLNTAAERSGTSELLLLDASATGDLFAFNGRTVKGAFGAEFRREELSDTPSGVAIATDSNPEPILGFSSTSANAERDSWSVYGEVYVPLADRLDLQIAGRYDDYDSFGGDFNPKVAIRYQPVEQLILRGNWSTSFRAPSLAQSGAGVLLSSYTVDCAATPAACDGDPTADGESLLSEDVGNPALEAEEAESFGFGGLFRPTRDIEFGLDYWNIRHENLVGIDEDDFIRRALAGEFPVVGEGALLTGVPGVEVDAGNFVTDGHFQITNLGYQETSGVDASYTHEIDLGAGGSVTLSADATYLLEFERQASPGAPIEDLAGDFRYPELLASARIRWRKDAWRASLSARYTSSYDDEPSDRTLEAVGLPPGTQVEVDSWTVFDVNASYDFSDNSFVQLNVRNLLDEEPPLVLGTAANVDHINHDSLGRFLTVRLTKRF